MSCRCERLPVRRYHVNAIRYSVQSLSIFLSNSQEWALSKGVFCFFRAFHQEFPSNKRIARIHLALAIPLSKKLYLKCCMFSYMVRTWAITRW